MALTRCCVWVCDDWVCFFGLVYLVGLSGGFTVGACFYSTLWRVLGCVNIVKKLSMLFRVGLWLLVCKDKFTPFFSGVIWSLAEWWNVTQDIDDRSPTAKALSKVSQVSTISLMMVIPAFISPIRRCSSARFVDPFGDHRWCTCDRWGFGNLAGFSVSTLRIWPVGCRSGCVRHFVTCCTCCWRIS